MVPTIHAPAQDPRATYSPDAQALANAKSQDMPSLPPLDDADVLYFAFEYRKYARTLRPRYASVYDFLTLFDVPRERAAALIQKHRNPTAR